MNSFKILIIAVLTNLSITVFAQDTPMQIIKMEVMNTYSCPMKCEGDKTYDKPGKCPICGMALREKVNQEVVYSCPMKCEGDKTYDKPGKCPTCGMALKEKAKQETVYSCPMKCEGSKTYDKPGKCPTCGMNLTSSPKEKKDNHSNHQR